MADTGYQYSNANESNRTAYAEKVIGKAVEARNPGLQRKAGGDERLSTDDGGHLIAHTLGGENKADNLIAMDRGLNRGAYKSMEKAVKNAVTNNPNSVVSLKVNTSGSSKRPDVIQTTSQIKNPDGKVKDVAHNSYTNLTRDKQEKLNAESGTDFLGYKETLTKEQRMLANEASKELSKLNLKDGLDTGWEYIHFSNKEGKKVTERERHDKFVAELKSKASQNTKTEKKSFSGSEDDGARVRTKGSERGSDLAKGKNSNVNAKGNVVSISAVGKSGVSTGKGAIGISGAGKGGNISGGKGGHAGGGKGGHGGSKGGHGSGSVGHGGSKGGHGSGVGGHGGGHGGAGGHGGGKGGHGGMGGR